MEIQVKHFKTKYKDMVIEVERRPSGNYVLQAGGDLMVADNYDEKTLERLYSLSSLSSSLSSAPVATPSRQHNSQEKK